MHAIDGMIFVVLDMIIALENGPCKMCIDLWDSCFYKYVF